MLRLYEHASYVGFAVAPAKTDGLKVDGLEADAFFFVAPTYTLMYT